MDFLKRINDTLVSAAFSKPTAATTAASKVDDGDVAADAIKYGDWVRIRLEGEGDETLILRENRSDDFNRWQWVPKDREVSTTIVQITKSSGGCDDDADTNAKYGDIVRLYPISYSNESPDVPRPTVDSKLNRFQIIGAATDDSTTTLNYGDLFTLKIYVSEKEQIAKLRAKLAGDQTIDTSDYILNAKGSGSNKFASYKNITDNMQKLKFIRPLSETHPEVLAWNSQTRGGPHRLALLFDQERHKTWIYKCLKRPEDEQIRTAAAEKQKDILSKKGVTDKNALTKWKAGREYANPNSKNRNLVLDDNVMTIFFKIIHASGGDDTEEVLQHKVYTDSNGSPLMIGDIKRQIITGNPKLFATTKTAAAADLSDEMSRMVLFKDSLILNNCTTLQQYQIKDQDIIIVVKLDKPLALKTLDETLTRVRNKQPLQHDRKSEYVNDVGKLNPLDLAKNMVVEALDCNEQFSYQLDPDISNEQRLEKRKNGHINGRISSSEFRQGYEAAMIHALTDGNDDTWFLRNFRRAAERSPTFVLRFPLSQLFDFKHSKLGALNNAPYPPKILDFLLETLTQVTGQTFRNFFTLSSSSSSTSPKEEVNFADYEAADNNLLWWKHLRLANFSLRPALIRAIRGGNKDNLKQLLRYIQSENKRAYLRCFPYGSFAVSLIHPNVWPENDDSFTSSSDNLRVLEAAIESRDFEMIAWVLEVLYPGPEVLQLKDSMRKRITTATDDDDDEEGGGQQGNSDAVIWKRLLAATTASEKIKLLRTSLDAMVTAGFRSDLYYNEEDPAYQSKFSMLLVLEKTKTFRKIVASNSREFYNSSVLSPRPDFLNSKIEFDRFKLYKWFKDSKLNPWSAEWLLLANGGVAVSAVPYKKWKLVPVEDDADTEIKSGSRVYIETAGSFITYTDRYNLSLSSVKGQRTQFAVIFGADDPTTFTLHHIIAAAADKVGIHVRTQLPQDIDPKSNPSNNWVTVSSNVNDFTTFKMPIAGGQLSYNDEIPLLVVTPQHRQPLYLTLNWTHPTFKLTSERIWRDMTETFYHRNASIDAAKSSLHPPFSNDVDRDNFYQIFSDIATTKWPKANGEEGMYSLFINIANEAASETGAALTLKSIADRRLKEAIDTAEKMANEIAKERENALNDRNRAAELARDKSNDADDAGEIAIKLADNLFRRRGGGAGFTGTWTVPDNALSSLFSIDTLEPFEKGRLLRLLKSMDNLKPPDWGKILSESPFTDDELLYFKSIGISEFLRGSDRRQSVVVSADRRNHTRKLIQKRMVLTKPSTRDSRMSENSKRPRGWSVTRVDEKGNAKRLSRPMPPKLAVNRPDEVYQQLKKFVTENPGGLVNLLHPDSYTLLRIGESVRDMLPWYTRCETRSDGGKQLVITMDPLSDWHKPDLYRLSKELKKDINRPRRKDPAAPPPIVGGKITRKSQETDESFRRRTAMAETLYTRQQREAEDLAEATQQELDANEKVSKINRTLASSPSKVVWDDTNLNFTFTLTNNTKSVDTQSQFTRLKNHLCRDRETIRKMNRRRGLRGDDDDDEDDEKNDDDENDDDENGGGVGGGGSSAQSLFKSILEQIESFSWPGAASATLRSLNQFIPTIQRSGYRDVNDTVTMDSIPSGIGFTLPDTSIQLLVETKGWGDFKFPYLMNTMYESNQFPGTVDGSGLANSSFQYPRIDNQQQRHLFTTLLFKGKLKITPASRDVLPRLDFQLAFIWLASTGQVEKLKGILRNQNDTEMVILAAMSAIKHGRNNILKVFTSSGEKFQSPMRKNIEKLLEMAHSSNNFEALILLLGDNLYPINHDVTINMPMAKNIQKWLEMAKDSSIDKFRILVKLSKFKFDAVAANNSVNVLLFSNDDLAFFHFAGLPGKLRTIDTLKKNKQKARDANAAKAAAQKSAKKARRQAAQKGDDDGAAADAEDDDGKEVNNENNNDKDDDDKDGEEWKFMSTDSLLANLDEEKLKVVKSDIAKVVAYFQTKAETLTKENAWYKIIGHLLVPLPIGIGLEINVDFFPDDDDDDDDDSGKNARAGIATNNAVVDFGQDVINLIYERIERPLRNLSLDASTIAEMMTTMDHKFIKAYTLDNSIVPILTLDTSPLVLEIRNDRNRKIVYTGMIINMLMKPEVDSGDVLFELLSARHYGNLMAADLEIPDFETVLNPLYLAIRGADGLPPPFGLSLPAGTPFSGGFMWILMGAPPTTRYDKAKLITENYGSNPRFSMLLRLWEAARMCWIRNDEWVPSTRFYPPSSSAEVTKEKDRKLMDKFGITENTFSGLFRYMGEKFALSAKKWNPVNPPGVTTPGVNPYTSRWYCIMKARLARDGAIFKISSENLAPLAGSKLCKDMAVFRSIADREFGMLRAILEMGPDLYSAPMKSSYNALVDSIIFQQFIVDADPENKSLQYTTMTSRNTVQNRSDVTGPYYDRLGIDKVAAGIWNPKTDKQIVTYTRKLTVDQLNQVNTKIKRAQKQEELANMTDDQFADSIKKQAVIFNEELLAKILNLSVIDMPNVLDEDGGAINENPYMMCNKFRPRRGIPDDICSFRNLFINLRMCSAGVVLSEGEGVGGRGGRGGADEGRPRDDEIDNLLQSLLAPIIANVSSLEQLIDREIENKSPASQLTYTLGANQSYVTIEHPGQHVSRDGYTTTAAGTPTAAEWPSPTHHVRPSTLYYRIDGNVYYSHNTLIKLLKRCPRGTWPRWPHSKQPLTRNQIKHIIVFR